MAKYKEEEKRNDKVSSRNWAGMTQIIWDTLKSFSNDLVPVSVENKILKLF
ncbi:MAG: hypothetical protein ACTSWY_09960 [Promethearchaeota archaeon]